LAPKKKFGEISIEEFEKLDDSVEMRKYDWDRIFKPFKGKPVYIKQLLKAIDVHPGTARHRIYRMVKNGEAIIKYKGRYAIVLMK